MEVKAGYKETEIGIIPDEWDTPNIGELLTFKNGLNKAKSFFGSGTPIVNYMDVYGNRGLLAHDLRGRVSLSNQELKAYEVRKGDVFFTRTSETADEVGITSVMLDDPVNTVFSGFVLRARPTDGSLDNQFKKYCFSASYVRKQITSQSTETTRALTNGRNLSKVIIARPPIFEQKAIAKALSDADALIEALEQLLAKKHRVKQGAMQELLTGKKRLPGFEKKHGYKQTDLGLVPEDWDVRKLGEIGTSIIGLTYKPTDVRSSGVLVLRSSNVQEGNLEFEDNVFVEMSIPEKLMVETGDILICVRNGSRELIGKCAYIDERALGMTFGAFMTVFRTSFHSFVFHQFQSNLMKRQIHEHLGATINQITNKSLNSFMVPMPPTVKEQTAIAEILSDMDAEITALEGKLSKAREVKAGMMSVLLTGKVRLVGAPSNG